MIEIIQVLSLTAIVVGQVLGLVVAFGFVLYGLQDIFSDARVYAESTKTTAKLRRDTAQFELELLNRKQSATQPE